MKRNREVRARTKRAIKRPRMAAAEEDITSFDPGLIHAIFKLVWTKLALEREKNESKEESDAVAAATPNQKKNRRISVNSNALKLSSELLRVFISESVQRAAMIAEVEGSSTIDATHLERILPQLLLDF